jgi:hypothetical protein
MKEEPVPIPPIPGISPAHALPLQLGQTRQAPLNFSRAIRCISFQSILSPFVNDAGPLTKFLPAKKQPDNERKYSN